MLTNRHLVTLAACFGVLPLVATGADAATFELFIAEGLQPTCSLEQVLSHARRNFGAVHSIERVAYVQRDTYPGTLGPHAS